MTAATPDRRAIITDALRKIDDLSARLEIAEKANTEPIAVVGMACRFPGGVNNPDQYWELLDSGRSGIVRVPTQRWDADDYYTDDHTVPGTICNREGGFLTGWEPDEFDAEFFAIAPREAAAMDPQQRLLIEVAWEALEDAGIPAAKIRGTQTGVFIGLTSYDYMATLSGQLQPEDLDAYIPTGNAPNFAAGRLSYLLGARGPALVVDTACSSSLTAIHLACQSLRWRETDTALVGGTNLLLNPGTSIACSRWGMLSPDGQCKSFDEGADGYVRSEGAGAVVLKRLADAERDGDRVLAVVRSSAVNQDGASSGVTVPNGPAQQALLRQALTAAKLVPADIDYVEAHGTGTPLGDPIELEALSQVFGDRGDAPPLVLGSAKTNLGHLEAAAGMAGFIKTVLALRHNHIPKHLNFTKLTPHATERASCLHIASTAQPWPTRHGAVRPRRAGVSSFGVSGTNAHVVLEQAPERAEVVESSPQPGVSTLVVSGKTVERVASTAATLAEWLATDGADVPLAEVAHTLNHHRTQQVRFGTVCATDHDSAVAGLRALASGQPAPGVVAPHDGACGPGTVFVYSGQGSQWAGMARELLATEPAFSAAVDELEPAFRAQAGFSLRDVIATGATLTGIERIQPALVGVQLALTALWRSYGVEPDAVIGHSMGEVTAAVVAGALTPVEGLKVIATRSALMARLSGQGAMALLELDATAAETLIADYPQLTVAVHASPRQTVVAGPPEQIDAVIAVVAGQDRLARRIEVDVASHHPIVDPILAELRTALVDLAPATPRIPILSTTDGHPPTFDADYWVANLRRPVRFAEAVAAAAEQYGTFVEVSPHPLLTYAITDTVGDAHHHSLGTLYRDTHDGLAFHTNLNATHTMQPPRTEHPAEPHRPLPATPWLHTRHWITATSAIGPAGGHPLLGFGITDPTNGVRVWEATLGPELLWLGDHRVDEACVLPGAAYAELAVAAATEAFGTGSDGADEPWSIRELNLNQVMHVADSTVVVTTLTGDEAAPRVEIRTRTTTSDWVSHASATLERRSGSRPVSALPFDDAGATDLDADELYGRLRSAGQQHGPAFQGIVGLRVDGSGTASAQVQLPTAARQGARRFLLHPVMVDIALQTLGATKAATDLAAGKSGAAAVILPVRLAGVRSYGEVTEGVVAVGSLRPTARPDRLVGQVILTAADGQVLLEIDEIEVALLQARGASDDLTNRLFTLDWEPVALDTPAGAIGNLLLIADPAQPADPLLASVRAGLAGQSAECHLISAADPAEIRNALSRKDISWDAIVRLYPSRAVDDAVEYAAQLDIVQARTLAVADIVKTVTAQGARNSPRLWLVTRGAQQLDPSDRVTLAQAQIRGIARVLTFENPELKTTIVDIDADETASAATLLAELVAGASHDEVALRDGTRYVHRVVPAPTTGSGALAVEERRTEVDLAGPGAVRLQVDGAGRLDALTLHAVKRHPPQAGQVEVRVLAAGLNFSDVLKTMGIYPGLDGAAPVIGGECVGVVIAVGDDVDSVEVGQRVIALGPGTFGSHLTTLADLVAPVPDGMTDLEAATFGVAYLTAWHSLCEVGRLAEGERVLIHSATGGVGLAALSIAKMVGARVYATAGSDVKREMLAGMGVEYVGDSRSTDFADEILEATDGYGVDVILNSLSGEAIRRGVSILAPGGRFVEIGKKDVFADTNLGLAAFARSGSFAVVDLDLNLRVAPHRYRRMLAEVLGHVRDGSLEMLPVTEFGLADAIDAFALMASGQHTGKIVVSIPTEGAVEAVASPGEPLVRADGGYVVVGGLGGLGFVVAQWLAERGAGMIVLNGRSGPTPEVAAVIARLNTAGCRVEVVTGDIAEPGTAPKLIATLVDAGYAPAGILHSATVLVDEIVLNLSESAATRVFAPKVAGSWWLHEATADLDLDWWLTFSSAASMLGSPGQGAYAAANSWVDGLVAHRRAAGLPAVGINWGPWAEVGRAQFFADLGFSMITAEQGMAAMAAVLVADRSRTGVFSLDARQWFQSFPAAESSSLFARLGEAVTIERSGGGKVRAELDALDPDQRPARLAAAIADEIRGVLRSTDVLDHDQAMESLGLDSLMALELRNRLEAGLGITLPVALVWAYPTISGLAGALCERMGYAPAADDPSSGAAAAEETEVVLSDDEVDLLADLFDASELEATTGAAES
jgi:phthiocerol/phenolphthiocerol synthesis type-I polyketide synthase C